MTRAIPIKCAVPLVRYTHTRDSHTITRTHSVYVYRFWLRFGGCGGIFSRLYAIKKIASESFSHNCGCTHTHPKNWMKKPHSFCRTQIVCVVCMMWMEVEHFGSKDKVPTIIHTHHPISQPEVDTVDLVPRIVLRVYRLYTVHSLSNSLHCTMTKFTWRWHRTSTHTHTRVYYFICLYYCICVYG